jgi:ankyrin repeat protein
VNGLYLLRDNPDLDLANTMGKYGETPLHLATKRKLYKAVDMLLHFGGDPFLVKDF